MKIQIRKGAFDCNSSSMHSLVVQKESRYYTEEEAREGIYIPKDGMIDLRHHRIEFGRYPFEVLPTLFGKAMYTIASMCRFKGDAVYNEVCDVIRSYIPEFVDFEMDFLTGTHYKKHYDEENMKEYYGEGNYADHEDQWVYWGYDTGYVDVDILSGFLAKENISITEFLKNKRYIVVVDGDEYCIYEDMKKCGLIDTSSILKEYPE